MTVNKLNPLPKVAVARHSSWESNVESYRSWVGNDLIDEIRQLSKDLQGLRVCQINATAAGSGVPELLSRLVPVYLALGITTDWRLICGDKDFFAITKSFHNALQGAERKLTSEAKQAYLKHNQISAEMLQEDYEVFVVHDPQPAALRHFKDPQHKRKWIWRRHTPPAPHRDWKPSDHLIPAQIVQDSTGKNWGKARRFYRIQETVNFVPPLAGQLRLLI